MRWMVRVAAAVAVFAAGVGNAQAPAQKLALVIGVSDYARTLTPEEQAAGFIVPRSLPNAVRDATLVSEALTAQGFSVTRLANPDKRAMLTALSNFSSALTRAGPEAVGVFYFAGHGAQGRPALERDIDNYLIPRNAALITEVDLESEALALSRVSATLKPTARGATVLILDACRDFALPAANRSSAVTRGLAEARAAPGTMIAYATSPGSTALDGPAGSNGPYARAFSDEVRSARGVTLEQVFISVRNKVLAETSDTQLPWENSSLRRTVVLGVAPVSAPAERPRPVSVGIRPGERFRECDLCPEMVVVPGGSFQLGSPATELGRGNDEGPAHTVTMRSFAAGKYEITLAEWKAFTGSSGRPNPPSDCHTDARYPSANGSWLDTGYPQEDRHPVACVSWQDAQAYIFWLSQRTGQKYRLLTEAEWEYAARAGVAGAYWFGTVPTPQDANFEDGGAKGTTGVGSYPANAFGLHDTAGNLWEWTEDCYVENYSGAPSDGSAVLSVGCLERVARGGSWINHPSWVRLAVRNHSRATYRGDVFGFRVARTL